MRGLLGKKIGMTRIFDDTGNMVPVTVLEAGPCVVTQLKTSRVDGYDAIQVGYLNKKPKHFDYLSEPKISLPECLEPKERVRSIRRRP